MKVKKVRTHGTGTLEQRKKGGVYYARWWDRYGKRQCKSTGCYDRDSATRKLNDFVKEDFILNENEKLETIKAKIEE